MVKSKNEMINPDTEKKAGNFTGKTLIMGIGDGGCYYVNRLSQDSEYENTKYLLVNTDKSSLDKCITDTLQIGENRTNGYGAGGDPDVGRYAAEESMTEILERANDADKVIICFGGGGGTGSGAAPLIVKELTERKKEVFVIMCLPFSYEGWKRQIPAEAAMKDIGSLSVNAFFIDNNRLLELEETQKLTFKQYWGFIYSEIIKKLADSVVYETSVEWVTHWLV